jgi:hypothetical protein
MYEINTGMAQHITSGEEAFARIFYDIETFTVPIYHDMVRATVAFARDDKAACARHVANIASQLKLVLGSYSDSITTR